MTELGEVDRKLQVASSLALSAQHSALAKAEVVRKFGRNCKSLKSHWMYHGSPQTKRAMMLRQQRSMRSNLKLKISPKWGLGGTWFVS